jgi:para-nitrobenzyl esterase
MPDFDLAGGMPQSEDCLYLNVLTPAKNGTERLPVMVWMHGAGFDAASGNDDGVNGLGLPSAGVVLVTVNMRLGVLGCLAHPLLSRESPKGVSGNYLFLDMVAALQWVQRNIAAFGGDPSNVTIFGVSGGAAKVVDLMASPLAKGLFHRAIGESGFGRATPLKGMEDRGERLFAHLSADKDANPLAAARAFPWERIIEAGQAVSSELKLPLGPWDASVDGWFLPDNPLGVFHAGKQNVVPFIMSADLGELVGPSTGLIPHYTSLFRGANMAGGKGYAYIFDHVPAGWKKDGAVACHGMDSAYFFGDRDYRSFTWRLLFVMAKMSGAKSHDPGFTDTDTKVSDVMKRIYTNFARTGNPSIKGVIDWPAWDEAKDQYLYITETPEVRSGFSKVAQKC